MKKLVCKECGQPREKGRKLCHPCFVKYNRAKAARRYHEEGKRTMYEQKCVACGKIYKAYRKSQQFCLICWKYRRQLAMGNMSTNKYKYVKATDRNDGENHWEHRRIAENVLKRKLTCHEIVHHINDNPIDNRLENLMIMDRRIHRKLHQHLDDQRVIFEKSKNENVGNCWNSLIAPMTTAWLETMGAKVIKLWEIGQSAAELATGNAAQEDLETCAPHTLTDNAEGEDTVQRTTLKHNG